LEPRDVLDAAYSFAAAIGDSSGSDAFAGDYPRAVVTAVGTDAARNAYDRWHW
jgi:hypothetical protein